MDHLQKATTKLVSRDGVELQASPAGLSFDSTCIEKTCSSQGQWYEVVVKEPKIVPQGERHHVVLCDHHIERFDDLTWKWREVRGDSKSKFLLHTPVKGTAEELQARR